MGCVFHNAEGYFTRSDTVNWSLLLVGALTCQEQDARGNVLTSEGLMTVLSGIRVHRERSDWGLVRGLPAKFLVFVPAAIFISKEAFMTRSELVAYVAREADLSIAECDRLMRLVTDTIAKCVSQGEKITLSGFGTFERKRRRATFARNPQTGETMPIAEQFVVTFRAGSSFKEAVKANDI